MNYNTNSSAQSFVSYTGGIIGDSVAGTDIQAWVTQTSSAQEIDIYDVPVYAYQVSVSPASPGTATGTVTVPVKYDFEQYCEAYYGTVNLNASYQGSFDNCVGNYVRGIASNQWAGGVKSLLNYNTTTITPIAPAELTINGLDHPGGTSLYTFPDTDQAFFLSGTDPIWTPISSTITINVTCTAKSDHSAWVGQSADFFIPGTGSVPGYAGVSSAYIPLFSSGTGNGMGGCILRFEDMNVVQAYASGVGTVTSP
jgi:hypothetical protein